jgi:hypothetical protein
MLYEEAHATAQTIAQSDIIEMRLFELRKLKK